MGGQRGEVRVKVGGNLDPLKKDIRESARVIKTMTAEFNEAAQQAINLENSVSELSAKTAEATENVRRIADESGKITLEEAKADALYYNELLAQTKAELKAVSETSLKPKELAELTAELEKVKEEMDFAEVGANIERSTGNMSAKIIQTFDELKARYEELQLKVSPELQTERLQAQIADIEGTLQHGIIGAANEAIKLENETAKVTEQFNKATEAANAVKEQLNLAQQQPVFKFQMQADEARATISDFESEIDRLNGLVETESDPVILRALQHELAEAENKLSSFRAGLSQPVTDIMGLQELYPQLEAASGELLELTNELERVRATASTPDDYAMIDVLTDEVKEAWAEVAALQAEIDRIETTPVTGELNAVGKATTASSEAMRGANLSARQMGAAFGMAIGGGASLRGIISSLSGMIFMMGGQMDVAKIKATAMWAAITLGVSLAITGITKVFESFTALNDKMQDTVESMAAGFVNFLKGIPSAIENISVSFSGLGNIILGLHNKIINIGKSTTVFKAIQGGFNDVTGVMSDWLMQSAEFNNALNQIRTNLLTAFTPIVEVITPIITSFMQLLARFTAVLAHFMATIFGTNYAAARDNAKALFEQARGINAVGEAARKNTRFLASFDELNVKAAENASGGGAGAGFDFDFAPPDFGTWNDFLKNIQDGLKGFVSWLNKIDWNNIRSQARSVGNAIGEAFSWLLGTDLGLMSTLAYTFAQSLNVLLEVLAGIAERTDFSDIGREVGRSIARIIEAFDPALLAYSINSWAIGILDLIINAFDYLNSGGYGKILGDKIAVLFNDIDWNGIFTRAGQAIIDGIRFFIDIISAAVTGVEWNLIGSSLADGADIIFSDVETWKRAGETLGETIKSILSLIGTFVTEFDWKQAGESLRQGILSFFETVQPEDVAEVVNGIVNGLLEFFNQIPTSEIIKFAEAIIDLIDFKEVIKLIKKIKEIKEIPKIILDMILKEGKEAIFNDFIDNFIEWIYRPLDDVDWVVKGGEILLKIIGGILMAIGGLALAIGRIGIDLIAGILMGIGTAISGIGTWLYDNLVKPIVDAVKKLFGIASPSKVFAEIGEWLIEGLLGGILDIFGSVAKFFGDIFSGLTEFFGGLFEDAWNAVKDVWRVVTDFFSGIWDGITNTFSNVKEWFSDKFEGAKNNVENAWSGTKTFFSNRWEDVKGAFSTTQNWFKTKFEGARDNIQTAFGTVKGFFSDRWDDIKGTFSGAWDTFKGIGKNILQGLKDGIGNIKDFIKDVFGGLADGVMDLLGISSPSRVFRNIGFWTGEGMADGILDSLPHSIEAIQSLADVEIPEIEPTVKLPDLPKINTNSGFSFETINTIIEKGRLSFEREKADYNSRLENKLDRMIALQEKGNELTENLTTAINGLTTAWQSGVNVDLSNGRAFLQRMTAEQQAITGTGF